MTRAGRPASKRASGRKAPSRDPGPWEAFITPPIGSNLKTAVDALWATVQSGPALTDERVLRPAVVRQLERNGMPKSPRPAWLEQLVDHQVHLARLAMTHLQAIPRAAGAPDPFAALVCLAVFRELPRIKPVSAERACAAIAEELGPGVSPYEVDRLLRAFLSRMRALSELEVSALATAVDAIAKRLVLPNVNVTVSGPEFHAIAGVIDELRFARGATGDRNEWSQEALRRLA
jgi:hypothetical protein